MTKHTLHAAPPPKGENTTRERKHFPEELLETLRDNPGKWAIGATTKNTTQGAYWRKRLKPEGFEIVARKNDEGLYDHWIAYTGEGSA